MDESADFPTSKDEEPRGKQPLHHDTPFPYCISESGGSDHRNDLKTRKHEYRALKVRRILRRQGRRQRSGHEPKEGKDSRSAWSSEEGKKTDEKERGLKPVFKGLFRYDVADRKST